ncbi:mechanosensitive ion channel family protein [Paraglaciecola chathamensis]|uniref:Small-conductance mechanosensitive channel n=3 Tax=Paraglaciecola chathamensis TaxID=368405 RepID=A0A8H9I6F1_9ALTE|nr:MULTISPECIES: mechanosensitive ion channel domain-containing protein [Paraglaciecola]AEE21979.1 MscS Mechanosensitive ion channel [Glaciecola sp. 4H-3-7+YE-5]MBN25840.1 mechanosensitive ion channel protein MscS [Alteromonadaceae bacterium]GAC06676.1 small conductance mechanosensitive channel [Paraglaciecola agarilytica NO2]GAC10434.1 small conductance mechanosensitive channel [Paraglaciecola chathamensis S18K6]GGZ46884.1 mechanosensitive ion channel protein [Paraglaciecola oceanifecundans]
MFEFDSEQMSQMMDTYVIPWGINIVMAILIYIVGKIVVGIIINVFGKVMQRSKYDDMLVDFIKAILNAILMLFVIIASLNELGVDTTSLVAILGAAGLAIGLSLQGSLQNFAAGVMLLVFRPFKAGDFVEAGGAAGVVKSISIFTTIMTSGDNKEIIVPNGQIYSGTITNYSAKETRRVDMVVGIGYDADLKRAKEVLKELAAADSRILQDPAPTIAVAELADSSVNFVVRPWVKAADFWAVKFDFTEAVKLRFDQEGISIPFPQMDVHLHKDAE